MSKLSRYTTLVFILTPFFAHAAAAGVFYVVDLLTNIFTALVPILIGMAVVVFFWGIVKFISKAGDEREHEEGKQFIIWGLITLFVIVSLWGIVGFIQESLIPVSGGGLGDLPTMPNNVPVISTFVF
jgi:heme/copper-type cytochrome/quinol oxidase subunit 2